MFAQFVERERKISDSQNRRCGRPSKGHYDNFYYLMVDIKWYLHGQ